MPLFEYDGPPEIAVEKRVPWKQIAELHKKSFIFRCSLGEVELRRPTQMDVEAVAVRLSIEHPEYAQARQAIQPYAVKMRLGKSLTAEEIEQVNRLGEALGPFNNEYKVLCFSEQDAPKTARELSDFLYELKDGKEKDDMLTALDMLSNPLIDGQVESGIVNLAQEFGIPLFKDCTAADLTPQQVTALEQISTERRTGKK